MNIWGFSFGSYPQTQKLETCWTAFCTIKTTIYMYLSSHMHYVWVTRPHYVSPTHMSYVWVTRPQIRNINRAHTGQILTPDSQLRTTCSLINHWHEKLNSFSTQNSPVKSAKCHVWVLNDKLTRSRDFVLRTGTFWNLLEIIGTSLGILGYVQKLSEIFWKFG